MGKRRARSGGGGEPRRRGWLRRRTRREVAPRPERLDDTRRNGHGPGAPPRGPATVQRLPSGTLERSQAGAPWWRYRRPDTLRAAPRAVPGDGTTPPSEGLAPRPVATPDEPPARAFVPPPAERGSGLVAGTAAAVLITGMIIAARAGNDQVGRFAVPVIGLLLAAALIPGIAFRNPDEPWLPRFVVLGVVFKLVASYARYWTLVDTYEGAGDASIYHEYGAQHAAGLTDPLPDLRKTNFVKWLIAHVYDFVGVDMMAGFFVFGLAAFVGSYLWYRATAKSVPFIDKRLYCAFVFFLPSIAFWPSSIGKEALMQLGIGLAALGTAFMVGSQMVRGLLIAAPGGWLMWVVRPHLLALVTFAGAVAYAMGRRLNRPGKPVNVSVTRPIGIVVVAVLSVFAISQAMHFLGMQEFSINAIESELNEQAGNTAQGGSQIEEEPGDQTLTPLSLPQGAVTVLLRPFVWEVESGTQILASIEAAAITLLVVKRRKSLLLSLTRARSAPFLLYCWTLTALYATAFSSFSNMGLLVRQRSLVLPAFFVLLCVDVGLAERTRRADAAGGDGATVGAGTAVRAA